MQYSLHGTLWKYPGEGAWYFIALPTEYADEIKSLRNPQAKGFGSIRVTAHIDTHHWQTSLFPDSKSGTYLLPIKKEIRLKNNLVEHQEIDYGIEIAIDDL